ncbi:hypothetical protein NDU88_005369 [Pleurodeles waltl]|uniref:Uncharacterized protein n=1 Tax=Pleurodeles waltl TaxID=8319 RepID=A0AAV7WCJ0_PLEWA|nr:hypothetical protein NDU88_005369 [Pleurodeles waltl]
MPAPVRLCVAGAGLVRRVVVHYKKMGAEHGRGGLDVDHNEDFFVITNLKESEMIMYSPSFAARIVFSDCPKSCTFQRYLSLLDDFPDVGKKSTS